MTERLMLYKEFEAAMSLFYRTLLLCRLPTRTKEDVLWEMQWANLIPLVPDDALNDSIIQKLHMDEGLDIDFDNLLRLVRAYQSASSASLNLAFINGTTVSHVSMSYERAQQFEWGWQLIKKYLERIDSEIDTYSVVQLKELLQVLEYIITNYPMKTVAEDVYDNVTDKLQKGGYFH